MRFALDYNRLYALEAEHGTKGWHVRLVMPEDTSPIFRANLTHLITLKDAAGKAYRLDASGSCRMAGSDIVDIELDGHRFGHLEAIGGGAATAKARFDRLTVTETRLIGEMPEGKGAIHAKRGDGSAKRSVFTDFHTHSSSEISGQDLVEIARDVGAYYPVRLLREMGIDASYCRTHNIPRIPFTPLEPRPELLPPHEDGVQLKDMNPADITRLAQAMNVKADRQGTTGEMELDYYRLRTPLTKLPEVFGAMFHKVAEHYRKAGVKYAEITISMPDNIELLKTLHRIIPEIEQDTGVKLRFLIGMPRTLPREKLHTIIEKTKALASSPYIVGIDVIGYEINKTTEFDPELNDLAAWIHRHNPEFTLRVHAGENAKNPSNLRHVLEIADTHNVRIRVGHALYGVDEGTLKVAQRLAKKGLLVLEFNPDSNLALNNIDSFAAIPFGKCIGHKIPFVVSSDGNGFYQTSARQLARDLEHIGLDEASLKFLRKTQKKLMDRQIAYSDEKLHAVEKYFPQFLSSPEAREGYAATLDQLGKTIAAMATAPTLETSKPLEEYVPAPCTLITGELPQALTARTPILLVGASGSSWDRIERPLERREAMAAVDMLVRALDPEKSYFVLGRAKNEGISKALEDALERQRREMKHPRSRFDVMSLLTPDAIRAMKAPDHLHYIQPIENNFVALAGRLVRFAQEQKGDIVAIGGSAFTRDIILKARHEGVAMQVMSEVEGASREKAGMLQEQHKAPDAKALITRMFAEHPECFQSFLVRGGKLNKTALEKLYQDSYDRVKEPLPAGTKIRGVAMHVRPAMSRQIP